MKLPCVSLDKSNAAILVIPAIGHVLPVCIPVVADKITGMVTEFDIHVHLVSKGLVGFSIDPLQYLVAAFNVAGDRIPVQPE